jgi:hypothetical protein
MGAPQKAGWREERRTRAWALKQEEWPQKEIASAPRWLPKNPLRFPFIRVATLVVSPAHSTAEVRQEFNIPYMKVRGIHAILVI